MENPMKIRWLCRNNSVRLIKNTLFYRDHDYLTVVPGAKAKHVNEKSTPYATVMSSDWGTGASHMRDTDAEKIRAML